MYGYARATDEWWAEQELLEGVHDVGQAGVGGVADLLVRPSFPRARFDAALDVCRASAEQRCWRTGGWC